MHIRIYYILLPNVISYVVIQHTTITTNNKQPHCSAKIEIFNVFFILSDWPDPSTLNFIINKILIVAKVLTIYG